MDPSCLLKDPSCLLKEVLECSVCLEQLDAESRVLPCQHTFCRSCLLDILRSHKELRCPECRELVKVPIDELPLNVLLMRILESLKNVSISDSSKNLIDVSLRAPCTNPFLNLTDQLCSSTCSTTLTTATISQGINSLVGHNSQLLNSSGEKDSEDVHCNGTLLQSSLLESTPTGRLPLAASSTASPEGFLNQRQDGKGYGKARALFDYKKREQRDLNLKKGDVVTLLRKVDANWYEGQLNGEVGFIPSSYVEIPSPVPSSLPQCLALYDFSVTSNEEQDCLPFKKGDVITILRRVDENWAVGQLRSKVGIFPVNFVKMNSAATACLVRSTSSAGTGSSPVVQPTERTQVIGLSSLQQPRTITSSVSMDDSRLPLAAPLNCSQRASTVSTNSLSSSSKNVYVAQYSYQPRKDDELELFRGSLYIVTDKCQDGWFKGRSVATDKIGVFPGNYVQPAKAQAVAEFLSKCATSGLHTSITCPDSTDTAPDTKSHTYKMRHNSGRVQSEAFPANKDPCIGENLTLLDTPVELSVPTLAPAPSFYSPSRSPPALPPRASSEKASLMGLIPSSREGGGARNFPEGKFSRSGVAQIPSGQLISDALQWRSETQEHDHPGNTGTKTQVHKTTDINRKMKGSTSTTKTLAANQSNLEKRRGNVSAQIDRSGRNPALPSTPKHTKHLAPPVKERFRCIVAYPPITEHELELKVGDVIFVHKKRDDGWYKGTLSHSGKTGLFPSSFVEPC